MEQELWCLYFIYEAKEINTSMSAKASARLGLGDFFDPNKVSKDQVVHEGWALELLLIPIK